MHVIRWSTKYGGILIDAGYFSLFNKAAMTVVDVFSLVVVLERPDLACSSALPVLLHLCMSFSSGIMDFFGFDGPR